MKDWVNNFKQITVFYQPNPWLDTFTHGNGEKGLISLEFFNLG